MEATHSLYRLSALSKEERMNYELAKKLKDAGWMFPEHAFLEGPNDTEWFDERYVPILEELIEACGDEITSLYRADRLPEGRVWVAKCCDKETHVGIDVAPLEAVARLYLALHASEVTP